MRITRSQKQWQAILEEQQTSGLTIIDYCREHQLLISSFYIFRKKQALYVAALFTLKSPEKLSWLHISNLLN